MPCARSYQSLPDSAHACARIMNTWTTYRDIVHKYSKFLISVGLALARPNNGCFGVHNLLFLLAKARIALMLMVKGHEHKSTLLFNLVFSG